MNTKIHNIENPLLDSHSKFLEWIINNYTELINEVLANKSYKDADKHMLNFIRDVYLQSYLMGRRAD